MGEIVEDLAGFDIVNDGSDGHANFEVFTAAAVPIASFTMTTAFSTERVIEAKFEKRIFVRVGNQIDASPVSTVAAARTALWNKLLPSERDAAVTTTAGLDCDVGFVDEHGREKGDRSPFS